jgi:site-specific DNA-cytosine methylase
MTFTHASIVPLIGGETIGSHQAFGRPPEYFMSYEAFWPNDQHIVNYYNNEIPYYVLDKGERPTKKVDVISSVCPCAGLSMLSHGYGDHNENNKWLIETARFVLAEMKPKVFWGENAPGLAGKIGDNVRAQMYKIGRDNGYSMTIYRTKSMLHGNPQVRERAFYFFWQGDKTPVMHYYNTPYKSIEQTILDARGNTQQVPINKKTPSQDPYYRFILEYIHNGMSHGEFSAMIEPSRARGNDTFSYIEKMGYMYDQVSAWMREHGYEKEAEACMRKFHKLASGGQIMRRGTIVPKDYIGAFVSHYKVCLTHPIEDRYVTFREAMSIMGMPDDFELLDPENCSNHICQNVPVQTAKDMATEVLGWLNAARDEFNSTYTYQYNGTRTHEFGDVQRNTLDAFL